MRAALVRFDRSGRVESVYLVANSERDQVLVEWGLRRIMRPNVWSWLRWLLGRKKSDGFQCSPGKAC